MSIGSNEVACQPLDCAVCIVAGRGGSAGNKFRVTLGLPVGAVINCADNTGAKNLVWCGERAHILHQLDFLRVSGLLLCRACTHLTADAVVAPSSSSPSRLEVASTDVSPRLVWVICSSPPLRRASLNSARRVRQSCFVAWQDAF
mgnify:CR=1 FL=1